MAMIPARLVVNGCSYMKSYAIGNGHGDLSLQLGIQEYQSLAEFGSCNNRIIRTTLRDSFINSEPTLYIIGMTFLSRYELPVNADRTDLDGKWLSFNNLGSRNPSNAIIDPCVSEKNLELFRDIWLRINLASVNDFAEDLQYRLLSMCHSLTYRGHSCIVFNTAEEVLDYVLDQNKFQSLRDQRQIINGLSWRSIPWQFEQGANWSLGDDHIDRNFRHVAPGQHLWLNQYLTNYIQEHKILE